jgi:hypothetical protein
VRWIKRCLVVELYIRRGAFWDAVYGTRLRRSVSPQIAVPPKGHPYSEFLMSAGGPRFSNRSAQPPEDQQDAERWWEQQREVDSFLLSWQEDLDRILEQVVPKKYRGMPIHSWHDHESWRGFISACVLYDPPATDLLEFAEYSDPIPHSTAPPSAARLSTRRRHVVMKMSPIRILKDPYETERVEEWLWCRVIEEIGQRYLEPIGIDIGTIVFDILENSPHISRERSEMVDRNESRSYILVDEHTTEEDVRKAFRTISATQNRRPKNKPKRDPLVALQCVILYDQDNAVDPSDKRRKKWTYQRLAEEFELASNRAAREYVAVGREILKEK